MQNLIVFLYPLCAKDCTHAIIGIQHNLFFIIFFFHILNGLNRTFRSDCETLFFLNCIKRL